ncbi:MAG: hypothetical protein JXA54_00550 [Candidatus Heimdallarchaeota archaeon]|nr:hypothetical protein [Candidatus Heimdallarchaeota archaeon]
MTPQVLVTTSLTPNILMHIFSCLEVEGSFYDSDYGLKHHFTISDEEYATWEELSKKCMTLGCNAELYTILFQIPSYIPTEDIDMVLDNYDRICDAVSEGTMESLIDSYPGVFDNLSIYAPMSFFENQFKKLSESKEVIIGFIHNFKKILLGVWERFYHEYWEKEAKIKIEKRVKELNILFSPINIINVWQKKFNIIYPYNEFIICLVEPTTTIASNFLAEKIMIAYKLEDLDIYKITIHEVGRSILLNINIFENEKLKAIALAYHEKLSAIVDAACVYLKQSLYQFFKIKDISDPYNVSEVKQIVSVFSQVWESLKDKDIYDALYQTYNKINPVV